MKDPRVTVRPKDKDGSESVRRSACETDASLECMKFAIDRSKITANVIVISVALKCL